MTIAQQLVDSFARIVRADGGDLEILSVEDARIRLAYRPGHDEECTTGQCVLPHLELQQMMREWLDRRSPGTSVVVSLKKNEA